MTTDDHEPPGLSAAAGIVFGWFAFYNGLIVPAAGFATHVTLGGVFAVLGALSGLRALRIARRRTTRAIGWVGLCMSAVGIGMLAYQLLSIATDGAVPPPFWSPYLHRL